MLSLILFFLPLTTLASPVLATASPVLATANSVLATASPLEIYEVGEFGGLRVKAPCAFGALSQSCTIDTMGGDSVLPKSFTQYPAIGTQKVIGIGFEFTCDKVEVSDLNLLGRSGQPFQLLRCPMEHSSFPLIGLPFFDGRSFRFDFPRAEFDWEMEKGPRGKAVRFGQRGQWLGVPATVGDVSTIASFDTGNPVTLVALGFAKSHPELFRKSEKEISPSLKAKGLDAYDVLQPIVVQGIELKAQYVYVGEHPLFLSPEVPVILGMNHMGAARWSFDLKANEFVVKLP